MRTLLIDNYDSFSYNLAHYLGEITGAEPTVIRNDEPGWRAEHLDGFDNVVISPGPGTPGVPADFGICRDVISTGRIPLLGVCLGHQGIAALGGGSIALAPEPRHGRKSPVLHGGTGLFAGIPSPQEVVRYHSWAVDGLSDELEPVAWTPDGVLMALRHRTRPQWGVQFHPESVATEHGHRLLANFTRLSRDWNLRHGRHTGPRRPHRPRPALPGGSDVEKRVRYRLVVEEFPTACDPERVYEALFLDRSHAFWLDSSRPDPRLGRFSMMGAAEEVVTGDVAEGTVTVRSAHGTRTEVRPLLDWLDDRLRTTEVVGGEDLPFDFHGGWVGYLGYELKAQCGGGLRHRSEHPDASLLFATRCAVFDHSTATTYLLALHTGEDEAPARRWLAAARAGIEAAAAPRSATHSASRPRATEPEPVTAPVTPRHDRGAYLELIESCQRAIAAGESYEICLTNMLDVECTLDVWSAYTTLRRDNPAPFAALLRLGELSVLSTSPERFLRVDGERRVEARPIKGTRPRGRSAEEDEELRRELARCEKDQAENLMIVDLLRNDLAQVATVGSVAVPELFAVESYATVHQLISTVTARLRPDRSAVDCVRAAFPGGSMTGAPKLRTMEIIDRLEDGPRGIYSGAIGYFSLSGSVDLSIAIRTLVAQPGRVGYGVGGAIVAMSDPVAEFDETAVKATPLLALLGARFPGLDPAEATRRTR